ncbi:hypothetical protein SEA_YASSIFIED_132 [Mycobacterium phage Yassified]|nr:hypothetical protein SEA_YASSIFIED_132 [Mycobacterium phage Yassified]
MSKLLVRGHGKFEFELNVSQFRSPLTASIAPAQTRSMMQYFPIRAGQPDINFTVQFRSNDEKHEFSNFVRDHQLFAQEHGYDGRVTLWWPERDIVNWTGFITDFQVVEKWDVFAPTVTFGVALIDSLLSEFSKLSSFGAHWKSIWGPQIPAYQGSDSMAPENQLRPPTPPSSSTPGNPDPTGPNPPRTYNGGGGTF